jgi:hypothetical protein
VKTVSAIISLALLLSVLVACEENPVQEYGRGLTDAYTGSQDAAKKANLDAANRAITGYRAAEGRYPANLEELSAYMSVSLSPEDYDYDPSTGRILLK